MMLKLATILLTILSAASVYAQQDADGWTILQPSADSVVMHVSNNGSDANDGLSATTPKQTVKSAIAALGKRRGNPDWIKLDRGSVFTEGRISFSLSGRSQAEPFVITSYGTGARPVLQSSGLHYWWLNGSPDNSMDHVAITGLDFQGPYESPGILFSGQQSDILIEDCRFRDVRVGVQVQYQNSHPKASGIVQPFPFGYRIRRNSFVDCYGLAGLNMTYCVDTVIEDNLFDRCGQPEPTIKKHNIYLKSMKRLRVNGNYFLRGSNMGLKCSSDDIEGFTDFEILNNYFYNNALSLDHSSGITHDPAMDHSHARGIIRGNVFHESARLFGTSRQDLAMWILNSREIVYENNYFVHKSLWNGNPMIAWGEKQDRITFKNNLVYDWQYPATKPETHYFLGNWPQNVTNGVHDSNTIAKDGRVFLDPERTVMTYLFQPDIDTVSDALWARTRDNWLPHMSAYAAVAHVIAGFEVVNPNPDGDPDTVPDKVIAVKESDLLDVISAVEGVLSALKKIAGRN